MTEAQKNQIHKLREKGFGYKAVGSMVGLSRDIVRNFCKKENLQGYGVAVAKNQKVNLKKET